MYLYQFQFKLIDRYQFQFKFLFQFKYRVQLKYNFYFIYLIEYLFYFQINYNIYNRYLYQLLFQFMYQFKVIEIFSSFLLSILPMFCCFKYLYLCQFHLHLLLDHAINCQSIVHYLKWISNFQTTVRINLIVSIQVFKAFTKFKH